MAKKQFFAICDTETTIDDTVADFAMVICDRNGIIVAQCGVLVKDHFDAKELFYNPVDNGFWGKISAIKRREHYTNMLNAGSRQLASVAAINRWIEKAIGQYNPTLTAYNLAFDASKCRNTGIDLNFADKFCLWQASVGSICNTKKFKEFALQNHAFNNVTEHGNMTFKTNAEIVAGYLNGTFIAEPHTALEDAIDFELPILKHIISKRGWKDKIVPYDWNKFQVKDHYTAKG
jgi:hypothetical protein